MSMEHGYNPGVPIPNSDGIGDASAEGEVRVRYDATGRPRKEIYLRHAGAIAAVPGQPYLYQVKGLAGSGQIAIDPAAVATTNRELVVATDTTAVNSFGWFAYWGVATAKVSGDASVGDYLKCAPGTSAAVLLTEGATRSNSSVAVARAAQSGAAAAKEVFLLGDRAVVNT